MERDWINMKRILRKVALWILKRFLALSSLIAVLTLLILSFVYQFEYASLILTFALGYNIWFLVEGKF